MVQMRDIEFWGAFFHLKLKILFQGNFVQLQRLSSGRVFLFFTGYSWNKASAISASYIRSISDTWQMCHLFIVELHLSFSWRNNMASALNIPSLRFHLHFIRVHYCFRQIESNVVYLKLIIDVRCSVFYSFWYIFFKKKENKGLSYAHTAVLLKKIILEYWHIYPNPDKDIPNISKVT